MINLQTIATSLKGQGKFWIAFTGDSITSTEWVHPNWREIVEYVLKKELIETLQGDWKTSEWGIRGFNFAYDGATTKDILEKINDMLLVKPDVVISVMGGNDPTFTISVQEHVENIKSVLRKLTNSGAKVVWCTSTPAGNGSKKNLEYEPYAKASMQIPQNENVQLIDMYTIYQQFPLEKIFTFISEEIPVEGIKAGDPDLQHPNQLGNAYIAKVILKEVFDMEFDAEKYMITTLQGEKFPKY